MMPLLKVTLPVWHRPSSGAGAWYRSGDLKDSPIPAFGGMGQVGLLFEEGQVFVPELMVAASQYYGLVRRHWPAMGLSRQVRCCWVQSKAICTTPGDVGKNLVGLMFEGASFKVSETSTSG
jgi:cobalamin-dependent methionine synthase I